jgi:glycosyltransferase involved in cell wall biosynthesis
MLSVIIPTYNESQNPYLIKILEQLCDLKDIEVICVDSESNDGTQKLLNRFPARVFQISSPSRAARINLGIEKASFPKIIIHHPRSLIEIDAFDYLKTHSIQWGGFTHQFDRKHPLLKFTSWYSNKIRADRKQIFYLDHCFYLSKDLAKQVFPIEEVDIFEDTLISYGLSKIMPGKRLPFVSTTSSIRFNKNGILKQMVMNLKMKIYFHLGLNHQTMNKDYEKDLNLNTDYESK